MHTFREKLLIFRKWYMSHASENWTLDDYPVRIRRNGATDTNLHWIAQILNWPILSGLGATPEAARADLSEKLEAQRKIRPTMPRPGTKVELVFSPATRIDRSSELYEDFRERILGYSWVVMSDTTRLDHFGDEARVRDLRRKIHEVYGVDLSDQPEATIADIFDRIRDQQERPSRSPGPDS